MKTDQQMIYESSIQLKTTLSLPASVSSMLAFFEKSIQQNRSSIQSSGNKFFESNSMLQTVFNKLKRGEKIHHYFICVQFLNYAISSKLTKFQTKIFDKPCVHVVAYRNTGILGFSQKTMVIIDNNNRRLLLSSSGKKEEKLKLKNFMMRESKDKKYCLIFESIVKYEFRSTYRLYFEQQTYAQTKIILRNLLDEVEKQKIYEELTRSNKPMDFSSADTCQTIFSTEYHFLNKQNLRALNNLTFTLRENEEEDNSVERLQIFKCSYKSITTNGNVYYLQQFIYLPKEDVISVLSSNDHKWNTICYQSSILQTSQTETVFVENYLNNDVNYTASYINYQNKDRFVLMSIPTNGVSNTHPLNIDYVYIKVSKITNDTTQISVKARIETKDSNREDFVVSYLQQFSNVYEFGKNRQTKSQLKKIMANQNQTLYFDARGEAEDLIQSVTEPEQLDLDKIDLDFGKENELVASTNYSLETSDLSLDLICIRQKSVNSPLKNSQLKIAKQHYLDAEWIRNKHGGLLCINERILTEQKKVLKHVFTSVGKNLFTSKSIMNISLPASVCTKISHLQMIASNFIYAPLLVETSQNFKPLERMKNLVVFLITIGNTGISSEKPFNPILGETYQGLINGCPIYLEQISHHPATSAYFMEGRGYKIMGVIEPKVEPTGINSVRCYSERQNKICFEDGSTVFMSFPKISLKGLLFGSRQFLFEGKNFLYDQKNNLYTEISFGSDKSFFGGLKSPADIVCGKIYKVKPELKEALHGPNKKQVMIKDYVLQQMSEFQGTWTQSIKFDKEQFFNFRTKLPCVLENFAHPLPSDSQFRSDIQRLCENNMKEAQSQKQRLQDLQRKDKSLREKNNHKKSK